MTQTPTQNDKLPLAPGLCGRSCGTTALLLALIFVAGGLLGAGLTVLVRPGPRRLGPPQTHVELYDRQMDRIVQDVKLSDEQIPKVRAALVNHWGPTRQQVLRLSKPLMLEAYDALSQDVLPLLTDKQKPLWQDYVKGRLAWVTMDPMICLPATQPASGPGQ
ncbi:MAG: hypothetical protein NTV86_23135 [Planctomycetota bacterium]|nr:hypothetical protein [Planctomycetota bacterium]